MSQDELQNRLSGYTTLLAKGILAKQKFLPRLGGVHTAVNEVFAYSVGITGNVHRPWCSSSMCITISTDVLREM